MNFDSGYTYNEHNEKLETLGNIILNLNYWDCECNENYIHSVEDKYCEKCNSHEEESPNSIENEVKMFLNRL